MKGAATYRYAGYHAIDRRSVPPALQDREEFRSLCPASATCTAKIPT
jgi:hypothetical protein